MAIKKTYTLSNGLVVPDAYIKIETCTSSKNSASARVGVYTSKDYANEDRSICSTYYIFKPDYSDKAKNLWEQAYNYLKTLEEFKDAVDV